MRGILFAAESGTRLWPITPIVPKFLVPVYDKPMIYFPLSVLLLAGIRDILLISTPQNTPWLQRFLGDGSQWGINLSYAMQSGIGGSAEVFLSGAEFIGAHPVSLIFGDNLFYGVRLMETLHEAASLKNGAQAFVYPLEDSEKGEMTATDLVHGQADTLGLSRSEHVMTNLYFYDNSVVRKARDLSISEGREVGVAQLNQAYLQEGKLDVKVLDQHIVWREMCTADSLFEAAQFVHATEMQQGVKISCPEEICWRQGYIDDSQLEVLGAKFRDNRYGQYLMKILQEKTR